MSIRRLAVVSVLTIQYLLSWVQSGKAQDEVLTGNLNFRMPTMGGKQFWADELFFHQWRIQQNVLTGHYRLLDENNIRYGWGTFEECRAALDKIKAERNLPPMKGKAVIVLHGLCGTRLHMEKLCRYLRTNGNYEVFNVTYPTTQKGIAEHAQSLGRIIENLDGIEEVSFVAHSMGNVVIRHYLSDIKQVAAAETAGATGDTKRHPKFSRFVMIAPPNHGSGVARYFAENYVFQTVLGDSGQQLGRDWSHLEEKLATPEFEFGIVAGGKGDGKGYNRLLKGDNDGVIEVETAKLEGSKDFVVISAVHPWMQNESETLVYTLRFLKDGSFTHPVPLVPKRASLAPARLR
jgi:hypothetical protein